MDLNIQQLTSKHTDGAEKSYQFFCSPWLECNYVHMQILATREQLLWDISMI